MKFFIILALAVFGATAAPSVEEDSVVERVTNAINKILEYISDPLLDLHDKELSIDFGSEQFDFTFTDIVLSGIKNLEISTLTFDEETSRLDYVFNFADVKANVEFDLILSGKLEAVNHPIVDVVLNGLKLSGYSVIDTTSSPHQLTDHKLLVTLDAATTDLTGILNDDALTEKLETLLNEQLPTIVNDVAVQLEPVVSPLVKSLINIIIRVLN